MALIKGKTGKFLRGAGATFAQAKLAEHQAQIMAERDQALARIRAGETQQAFEQQKELLNLQAEKGLLNDAESRKFSRNEQILEEEGAIDENGKLKPVSELTEKAKMAAISARLIPGAVGSAEQTITSLGTTEDVGASNQRINTLEKFGSGQGQNASNYEDLANAWDVNKGFIEDSIPEIKEVLEQSPGSSLSKAVQSGLSKIVGNTEGADAQAILEQYGAIFLQGIPFPPGQQSDKEMQQRALVVSDQIANPNISPEMKIKILSNFIEWQDKRAAAYRAKVSDIIGTTSVEPKNMEIPVAVTTPDGQVFTFPNQEAADQFKKAAGL